jgi:hypothetical protein
MCPYSLNNRGVEVKDQDHWDQVASEASKNDVALAVKVVLDFGLALKYHAHRHARERVPARAYHWFFFLISEIFSKLFCKKSFFQTFWIKRI